MKLLHSKHFRTINYFNYSFDKHKAFSISKESLKPFEFKFASDSSFKEFCKKYGLRSLKIL